MKAIFLVLLSHLTSKHVLCGEPGPNMEEFWRCVDRSLDPQDTFSFIDCNAPIYGEGKRVISHTGNATAMNTMVYVNEECIFAGNGVVEVTFGSRESWDSKDPALGPTSFQTKKTVRVDIAAFLALPYILKAKVLDHNGLETGVEIRRQFYGMFPDRFMGREKPIHQGPFLGSHGVYAASQILDDFDTALGVFVSDCVRVACSNEIFTQLIDNVVAFSTTVSDVSVNTAIDSSSLIGVSASVALAIFKQFRSTLENHVLQLIRREPPIIPGQNLPKFFSDYIGGACHNGGGQWGPVWQGDPKKEKHLRRNIGDFFLEGAADITQVENRLF